MAYYIPYALKRIIRNADCLLTRKHRPIVFRGHRYSFFATLWWDNVSQAIFDAEISPYFEALDDFRPSRIVDVGAATGHFAIVAAKVFPNAVVHAFEPSQRQRILLSRNAKLNQVIDLDIEPIGLWNKSDVLQFRTIGDESSFAVASRYHADLRFPEKVHVIAMDEWVRRRNIDLIDLIKIDAEGAEIEILQGAKATLKQFRPRILVQAYHLRNGRRTFETCAAILEGMGYKVGEHPLGSALLVAR